MNEEILKLEEMNRIAVMVADLKQQNIAYAAQTEELKESQSALIMLRESLSADIESLEKSKEGLDGEVVRKTAELAGVSAKVEELKKEASMIDVEIVEKKMALDNMVAEMTEVMETTKGLRNEFAQKMKVIEDNHNTLMSLKDELDMRQGVLEKREEVLGMKAKISA